MRGAAPEGVVDGAGILAKAAWPAKSDGERLRYSVALLKVTGRNRQLSDRVLVVTDRTLCDVQLKGEKLSVMHRVQLEHLRGYSSCPASGSEAFVVHIDRRNDPTKDFLMASAARDHALAAVVAAYADRARRQLRRFEWDAASAGGQALARLEQQQQQQLQPPPQQQSQQPQEQEQRQQDAAEPAGAGAEDLDATDGFIAPRAELLSAKVSEFSASEWTPDACESYVREQFNTRRKEEVMEHVQELSHVKAHAASQLQQSVVEHYRTFIRTSNETAEVDEDLSHLRKQLISLKTTITALRETSFDFTEEGSAEDLGPEAPERQQQLAPVAAQPGSLREGDDKTHVAALPADAGAARVDRVLSMLMRAAPEPSAIIDAPTLKQLLTATQAREYREGETIVREGDAAQTFFMVDEGECIMQRRVSSGGGGGSNRTTTLQRGCCFGANALRADGTDATSDETVTAVGGVCRCLQLTSTQFSTLAVRLAVSSTLMPNDCTAMIYLANHSFDMWCSQAAVPESSSALSDQSEETLIELDVLIAERK